MVEVPTVRLLAEHLGPVGDVLGILVGANNQIVALKGEMRFDLLHDISVMFQKLALEVVVEENRTFCPGVQVK